MSSPARSTPESLPTLVEDPTGLFAVLRSFRPLTDAGVNSGGDIIMRIMDDDEKLLNPDAAEVPPSASEGVQHNSLVCPIEYVVLTAPLNIARHDMPQRPLQSRSSNRTNGGQVAKVPQPKPAPYRRPPVRKQLYEFIRGPAQVATAFSVAQAEYRDKVMYCWFIKMGRKRGELPTDEDKERIKKDPHVIEAGEKLNMADKAFTESGEYVTSMTVTCDSHWSVERKLAKKKAELDQKYRAEQRCLQESAVGIPRALRSSNSKKTSEPPAEYGFVSNGSS